MILDVVYKSSFSKCIRSLTETGCYLMANAGPGKMLRGVFVQLVTTKKVKFALASETAKDLNFLADLISTKKIKPVIDRTYPLEETMDAHRYVENGHKKGSVIIRVFNE